MSVPQVGQTVENLELLTPTGEVIRLEDLLDREYLLLIFLRHLT
jgi:peroxiredoxin